MQKRKKNHTPSKNKPHLAGHIAAGAAAGLASAFVLFAAGALVMCKVDIPPQMLTAISTILISLAVIPAGLVLAFLEGERGMLCGLLTGLGFFSVLWIAALCTMQTEFTPLAVIKGAAMILAGTIGGFLGMMLKEHRRKIH